MNEYRLNVNGERVSVSATAGTPLLWVLRDNLGLTGTKYGCGIGICGACTIHVGGRAVRSCVYPVEAAAADAVDTIEGLPSDHAVIRAWIDNEVPQCGYCQPGMVMAATAFLAETPNPTEDDIRSAISNICRCGTYHRVVAAISDAAPRKTPGRNRP